MTRRSLLSAGAGALAGALAPRGVLARTGDMLSAGRPTPPPRLDAHPIGTLTSGRIATVELPRVADLVGVQWRAPHRPELALRFRLPDGRWSRWAAAGSGGHGPEAAGTSEGPTDDKQIGEPVWTGGTTAVQLRAAADLTGVTLHAIDVSGGVGARRLALASALPLAFAFASSHISDLASARVSDTALPLAAPVFAAGPGQPPIVARRAWAGADSPPRVAPEYGAVRMAFVHHTDTPNGYAAAEVPAMLRGIYAFHRYVNDWNDIGYNFAIDLYGHAFEARAGGIDEPVVGAHAGGYNLVSTGIAVLGTFASVAISPVARSAMEHLLAWKLSLHGVPVRGRTSVRVDPAGARYSRFPANALVSLPCIAGHRDADATDCPGDVLYGELPRVRAGADALAVHTAGTSATLTAPSASPPATPGTEAGTAPPQPGGQVGQAPAPSGGAGSTPAAPNGGAGSGPTTTATPSTLPASMQEETHVMITGVLRLLDGTPVAGAPILLQARSVRKRGEAVEEQTLAQTVTDAQGNWSIVLPAHHGRRTYRWLRALSPGSATSGATVSEPLRASLSA